MSKQIDSINVAADTIALSVGILPVLQIFTKEMVCGSMCVGPIVSILMAIIYGLVFAFVLKTDAESINASVSFASGWFLGSIISVVATRDWWPMALTIVLAIVFKVTQHYDFVNRNWC